MIHLVTGYAGYEHIQAEDDGAYNAAFFGDGQYVMGEGNQFEGSIVNNNTVRILDGNGLMYGRHFRMQRNTYEDITITTGTAGKNRADLICMTYEKNGNDGTEKACLQVVKGVETEGEAVIPDFTDGNILEGASFNQMPLYKVLIKGVVLSEIVPLFQVIPTYKELAEKYAAEFKTACTTHLSSLAVLDTLEEIEANTQEKQLAGALAVKELNEAVASQNETLAQCLKSVSDGKSKVAGAITAQGVNTAADATFEIMAANIGTVGTQKYNGGYNAGVTAADNRANGNSVNYKTGYNNGYSAGMSAATAFKTACYGVASNIATGGWLPLTVASTDIAAQVSAYVISVKKAGTYRLVHAAYSYFSLHVNGQYHSSIMYGMTTLTLSAGNTISLCESGYCTSHANLTMFYIG